MSAANEMAEVRVRFAPSPTGYFHLGSARGVLFNWLFARRHGGKFILRIEDTDRTRYHKEAVPDLIEGVRWLGLEWDEGPEVGGPCGPYFQSERLALYQEYARKLVDSGHAYRCYCSVEELRSRRQEQRELRKSPGYDRRCRELTNRERQDREARGVVPVVRLKVPLTGETVFHDLIRGDIRVRNERLDDLILLKSDGFPTYHLAVVVDDHLMEISHVLRGDEWLATTPHQVLEYQAFGWTPPQFAHLPVILSPTGKGKMSKRKTVGADGRVYNVMLRDFRAAGYLPEAVFNFLALTGWSYDDKTEILTRAQIIESFDLAHVSSSPAKMSYEKLDWLNGMYMRTLSMDDLAARILPFLTKAGLQADLDTVRRVTPLIQERIVKLSDAVVWTDFLFVDELSYAPEALVQKKMTVEQTGQVLAEAHRALSTLRVFDEVGIEQALRASADAMGLKAGQFLGTLRVATTGKQVAPPLFGTLVILGREKVLSRIASAQGLLGSA
jgi:glutamyl-tRNA synthetase